MRANESTSDEASKLEKMRRAQALLREIGMSDESDTVGEKIRESEKQCKEAETSLQRKFSLADQHWASCKAKAEAAKQRVDQLQADIDAAKAELAKREQETERAAALKRTLVEQLAQQEEVAPTTPKQPTTDLVGLSVDELAKALKIDPAAIATQAASQHSEGQPSQGDATAEASQEERYEAIVRVALQAVLGAISARGG
eukprot:15474614-Alexandrium_andersonii.AAC.1